MYAWIWHHLPFGRPGKITGSVLLALGVMALLWFVAFPAIDPHLPFNDGQVTSENGPQNPDDVNAGVIGSESPGATESGAAPFIGASGASRGSTPGVSTHGAPTTRGATPGRTPTTPGQTPTPTTQPPPPSSVPPPTPDSPSPTTSG